MMRYMYTSFKIKFYALQKTHKDNLIALFLLMLCFYSPFVRARSHNKVK